MLNGIDISKWQSGIDLSKINADFVIVKATEGVGYVDPCCDGFFQHARELGKLLGFYHFARPHNKAKEEAEHFYKNTKNYFGLGIPVLDWESENQWDVGWAKTWLDEIYSLTNVRPLIYMSASVVNNYDWSSVAANYGLWVAKYRDTKKDYNYDMTTAGSKPSVKHWHSIAMWQWTSVGRLDGFENDLDCDLFYGDERAWMSYVSPSATDSPSEDSESTHIEPEPKLSVEEVAQAIADGDGEWYGVYGEERVQKLTTMGYVASEVQSLINKIMEGSRSRKSYYVVKAGDTLSLIAKAKKTSVAKLASLNGITDVNRLSVGQKLRIK